MKVLHAGSNLAGGRREADDRTLFPRDHALKDELAQEENGLGIDRLHLVPVGLGQVEQIDDMHDAGVVDEHVDGAELAFRHRDHRLAVSCQANVPTGRDGLSSKFPNLGGDSLGTGLVQIRDGDVRTRPGATERYRPTNAAGAARDQHCLVRQETLDGQACCLHDLHSSLKSAIGEAIVGGSRDKDQWLPCEPACRSLQFLLTAPRPSQGGQRCAVTRT